MKTTIAWKLDRRSIFCMTVATTIAISSQVNLAVARLDKNVAARIDRETIAPSTIHAQNPAASPSNPVITPNNSNTIIEQRETTGSDEQTDLKLLKKALQTFYQSNRIQSRSNMAFDFSASGIKGQVNVNMTTVVENGDKFNSQVIFANPQSVPIKFNIISNGKKVWIYRPDKRIYRETTLAKFNNERFWVGISVWFFSMISEKDRLNLINNAELTSASSLGAVLKAPQIKEFKGERVLVDDRSLYAFSSLLVGNYKFTSIVQPDTGALSSLEMSGTADGMNILLKEKIESWKSITSIDKKTFTFSPPKGVKRVKTLSIMPFGK
jgi:outer membrane lipoprotein-sorting protein